MVLKISSNKLLKDVKIIENDKFFDKRGFFTKFFHKEIRESLGFNINEIFYSENYHGVIRGIHYQKKDEKLGKIIKCVTGEVLDFFIDLRKNSKTFGHYSSQVISEENNLSVFVPEGFGHGFSVLSDQATVIYLQSGEYNPKMEGGIHPLSIDFDWEVESPIISDRDNNHPNFNLDIKEFKL